MRIISCGSLRISYSGSARLLFLFARFATLCAREAILTHATGYLVHLGDPETIGKDLQISTMATAADACEFVSELRSLSENDGIADGLKISRLLPF